MPRRSLPVPGVSTSLPFSHAIRAGDTVYVSGQASVDETGAYVEDDFAGELRRSFANVERILEAAGGSLDDVVKVTVYLSDMAYRDEYNALYVELWNGVLPARTTVPAEFGFLKVEVDVIAHIPEGA